MVEYTERFYRDWAKSKDLVSFKLSVGETDLFISAQKNMSKEAESAVRKVRSDIEEYIKQNPNFKDALKPVLPDESAPQIVRNMINAGILAGVGPTAAIAGAIAEAVGRVLMKQGSEVIVENGGDIFISSKHKRVIGVFAGNSPFTNRLGIEIKPEDTPCGVCTSSGTVGPSFSFGKADAAIIYSRDCALADAAATAVCNLARSKKDIDNALKFAKGIKGVKGAFIVIKDAIGAWGKINIVKTRDSDQKTRDSDHVFNRDGRKKHGRCP